MSKKKMPSQFTLNRACLLSYDIGSKIFPIFLPFVVIIVMSRIPKYKVVVLAHFPAFQGGMILHNLIFGIHIEN